jgi:putative hydrolase of the HAD superfamily
MQRATSGGNAVLVLDLDGVVVRGHAEGGRWDMHLERDLGISIAALQEHFFAPHWQRIATGDAEILEVLHAVWWRLGTAVEPQQLLDYWFAADSLIDSDVLAAVDAWRETGRPAFLATVQEHRRARYLMETLGLARHFDAILYSADLGAAKPEPRFFERAHARLPAVAPADVIFLDDHLPNVEAAKGFGWRARHYATVADLHAAIAGAWD